MKKHIAFLLSLVMLLSFTAIGFADVGSLAGSYKVTKFTEDGQDMSESLAMMDALGMSIYLTVDESGAGEMSMMGEEAEKLIFDPNTMTVRAADDDDILYFTFENGTITLNDDGDILVFSPIDAADVKTEAPDWEALFSGLASTETSGNTESTEIGNYTLKDTVVADDETCSFVIQDIADDGYEIVFKVLLENKTDKNLTFSIDNVTVNGYVNDPFWIQTVAAGKKAIDNISFTKSGLAEYGLLPIDELSFDLNVSDADDWNANYLLRERHTVYPTGKNSNDIIHPERITTPTEKVIYENADFSFIMLDEDDGWFGHEYRIYIENNTDKNLAVSWDNVSVNDFMCDPFWGTTVPAYSRSYNGISFDETTLKEIGIDDPGKIEKLEFTLIVHDNNDWAADPILKQICTYERS